MNVGIEAAPGERYLGNVRPGGTYERLEADPRLPGDLGRQSATAVARRNQVASVQVR